MQRRDVLALGAALSAPALLHAQPTPAWPTRGPIRLVAQFPPGGLVDVVSRLMAPILQEALGQTVVVENRAGAAGLIGTEHVARQPADGYTLLVSHAIVHVYAAAVRRTMPFDAINDFTHMGLLVEAPMVLLVRGQSPFQSLEQYLAAARTKPTRFASSGIGSAPHLLGELLRVDAKAPQLEHVPYQGTAPAMQDLLGGQVESLIDPVTTNVSQLRAGSLRALAVSSPQRLPGLPSIPTFAELGFPRMTAFQWLGLSGPRDLPAPIVQRLTSLIPDMLRRPELVARFEEMQTLPRARPVLGEDFVKLIREQMETWRAVAKAANIEIVT